ncbi:hypothetical protein ZWY2020_037686 [Hordeum vulgare]|nr:hypothetical protein ZWY2020_037686 [Hordeum vulgare]
MPVFWQTPQRTSTRPSKEATRSSIYEPRSSRATDRSWPVVEGGDLQGAANLVVSVAGEVAGVDEGAGGLAVVVGAVGGGCAPGAADGAAAEERFGGQADEDFPDDDLFRDAADYWRGSCCTCTCCLRRRGANSRSESGGESGDGGVGVGIRIFRIYYCLFSQ